MTRADALISTRWAWALWLGLSAGCAHVKLELPPPDAPFEARAQAYERLKPKSREQWRTMGVHRMRFIRSMVLQSDEVVVEPADLLPLVPEDSETARHVRAYEEKNRPWDLLGKIAGCGFGTGAALATFSVSMSLARSHRGSFGPELDGAASVAGWVGMPVMVLVPLVAVVVGWLVVEDTEPDRMAAFSAYDRDLQRALGL